jgi:hypothetical protein
MGIEKFISYFSMLVRKWENHIEGKGDWIEECGG